MVYKRSDAYCSKTSGTLMAFPIRTDTLQSFIQNLNCSRSGNNILLTSALYAVICPNNSKGGAPVFKYCKRRLIEKYQVYQSQQILQQRPISSKRTHADFTSTRHQGSCTQPCWRPCPPGCPKRKYQGCAARDFGFPAQTVVKYIVRNLKCRDDMRTGISWKTRVLVDFNKHLGPTPS